MDPHPFRMAVEARDLELLAATLAPDIAFHTPIRFTPFLGRRQALAAMSLAASAFAFQDGFTYLEELRRENVLVLLFRGRIGERTLEGVDCLTLRDDGLVSELKVMIRPFSAVQELLRFAAEREAESQ